MRSVIHFAHQLTGAAPRLGCWAVERGTALDHLTQLGSRPALAPTRNWTLSGRRAICLHPEPVHQWTKPKIEEGVYNIILDNVAVAEKKVTLDSNFVYDLLLDKGLRYGILEDIHVVFRINMDLAREETREFNSGREIASWLAGHFEETGQLVY